MKKRIRVGVIFGGRSSEHEISLRSALSVMSAMDPERYEVVPIGISRTGRWYLRHDALAYLADAAPKLGELAGGGAEVTLPAYPAHGALVASGGGGSDSIVSTLDVIFPVLHGSYGEDGAIQGLLDLAGVAYVGAGVLGSAIGMDKDVQKRLLREANIPVVRFAAFGRGEYQQHPERAAQLAEPLGYPVFVKPNALGSSIGISRVKSAADLAAALDDAFQYDRRVLIEAACSGREFECSVLGNDNPEASLPGEVIVTGHQFYSYESKYVDPNGAQYRIPASLPQAEVEKIRRLSIAAFKALGLRGMARVDFLARPDLSEIFVNEVNTIPGFTPISMYPKLWEVSGLRLPDLISRLIELAIEEHRERADLKITYQQKKP